LAISLSTKKGGLDMKINSIYSRLYRFKSKYEDYYTSYLFVAPIIILMAIWFYYPVIKNFAYSLTDANLLRLDKAKFIGASNYINVLKDDHFIQSLKVSFTLTIFVVPIQSIVALVLATNLNNISRFKATLRTLYFIPYITSTIAVTTVFMRLFVQNGIGSKLFAHLGIPNVTWPADVKMALPFLIMICIWQNVGFFVVVYLAGLQTIPSELYEACDVDGTSPLQKFFYITIPMLKPTTVLVLLSGTMSCLQVFDQAYAIGTGGGSLGFPAGATSTASIYYYSEAFKQFKVGYGSASAFIIFIIILTISIVQKYVLERDEVA